MAAIPRIAIIFGSIIPIVHLGMTGLCERALGFEKVANGPLR